MTDPDLSLVPFPDLLAELYRRYPLVLVAIAHPREGSKDLSIRRAIHLGAGMEMPALGVAHLLLYDAQKLATKGDQVKTETAGLDEG